MKNWKLGLGFPAGIGAKQSELFRNHWMLSSKSMKGKSSFISTKGRELEKMKYNVSQTILDYQQFYQLSFTALARELGGLLTKDDAYDICHKNLANFSLAELVIYAHNLGITSIPCRHCGEELFPSLWEGIILFLKAFETTPPRQVSQLWTKHRHEIN